MPTEIFVGGSDAEGKAAEAAVSAARAHKPKPKVFRSDPRKAEKVCSAASRIKDRCDLRTASTSKSIQRLHRTISRHEHNFRVLHQFISSWLDCSSANNPRAAVAGLRTVLDKVTSEMRGPACDASEGEELESLGSDE